MAEPPAAKAFVINPATGTATFGEINADVAAVLCCCAGPIHLQFGYPGAKGYGQRHVHDNEQRMRTLKNRGYTSFEQYAAHVATNYNWIGADRESADRLILVCPTDGYDLTLIIKCFLVGNSGLAFWNIVTGIPKRCERAELLFRK